MGSGKIRRGDIGSGQFSDFGDLVQEPGTPADATPLSSHDAPWALDRTRWQTACYYLGSRTSAATAAVVLVCGLSVMLAGPVKGAFTSVPEPSPPSVTHTVPASAVSPPPVTVVQTLLVTVLPSAEPTPIR